MTSPPAPAGAPSGSPAHHAKLPKPVAATLQVVVMLVAILGPMVVVNLLVGMGPALGTLMGTIGGMAGSSRSGWARALMVVPFMAVMGFAATLTGFGWGWAIIIGFAGLVASVGFPYGYMPAVMYATFVPTIIAEKPSDIRTSLVTAAFVLLGGLIGVLVGKRMMRAPRTTAAPAKWVGHEGLLGLTGAVVMGGAAAIAVASDLPHSYWLVLTIIVLVPPMAQGDSRRGAERLVGSVAALVIVLPLSLLALPIWAWMAIGAVLMVVGVQVMQKSYTLFAFFLTAGVVLMVTAGHDVAKVADIRAFATVLGVIVVLAVIWVFQAVLPRIPGVSLPIGDEGQAAPASQ